MNNYIPLLRSQLEEFTTLKTSDHLVLAGLAYNCRNYRKDYRSIATQANFFNMTLKTFRAIRNKLVENNIISIETHKTYHTKSISVGFEMTTSIERYIEEKAEPYIKINLYDIQRYKNKTDLFLVSAIKNFISLKLDEATKTRKKVFDLMNITGLRLSTIRLWTGITDWDVISASIKRLNNKLSFTVECKNGAIFVYEKCGELINEEPEPVPSECEEVYAMSN